jgi:hypothetical protein
MGKDMAERNFQTESAGKFSDLFPYFICRVAGISAQSVEQLRACESAKLFEALYTLEKQLHLGKEKIIGLIYNAVSTAKDGESRNTLLQLKRDLYNLRPLPRKHVASFLALLPAAVANEVSAFMQKLEECECVRSELEKVYSAEERKVRRRFQALIDDADFKRGLLLSSQSLFSSLERYAAGDDAGLRAKQEQIERGLLRYFSRMAMKISPFATFCALIPGEFRRGAAGEKLEQTVFEFLGDPRRKKSFIRMNKSLYGVLLEHLKSRPAVKNFLNVELNPTIRVQENKFVFLSLVNGREVFQRLQKNAALNLIMETFDKQPHLPLLQMIDALCENPKVEASREEAGHYFDKLLEIGFLRFRTGIHEQEVDWDVPFKKLLTSIDDEDAKYAATLLEQLRAKIEAYSLAPVDERANVLNSTLALIESSFKTMEIPTTIKMNIPFYEDATADSKLSLSLEALSPALKHLRTLTALTLRLAWPRSEQATMRHFFDAYYGREARAVPLLQFYEDYYREHFKAHIEKEQKAQGGIAADELKQYNFANPFNLEIIQQIQTAHARLTNLIRTRWSESPHAEEIVIETPEIEKIIQEVEPSPSDTCRSISFFSQLVSDFRAEKIPALVVQNGNYLVGYGKFFSRFLHMFPEAVQNRLYEANRSLTDQCLAEICGDAKFNANLHPPPLPWEISYPTGESGPAEKQIRSAEICVEADPDDRHALCLRHQPTGKRIIPVDLGFMNPRMRPPLYQLLLQFTPPSMFWMQIPESLHTRENVPLEENRQKVISNAPLANFSPAKINYRPRITYNRILILSRRLWQVPSELFPQSLPKERACDYFVRANRWRKEHGIPQEIFIRVRPLPYHLQKDGEQNGAQNSPQDKNPIMGNAVSRDLYKPQYIDFSNPLLVKLFGRIAATLKHFVVNVEERLPATDDLLDYQNNRYVTEFILQFNFPGGKTFSTHAAEPNN